MILSFCGVRAVNKVGKGLCILPVGYFTLSDPVLVHGPLSLEKILSKNPKQYTEEQRIKRLEASRRSATKRIAADPGLFSRMSREWREKNPGRSKEYREENKDQKLAHRRATRKKPTPEQKIKAKATYDRWCEDNKEILAEKRRLKRQENPEKYREKERNRRALEKNAQGSHTEKDVLNILALQKSKCANCKNKLIYIGPQKYHVDHIQPLSRGGSNSKDNLQILCQKCNNRKYSKDPFDWAKSQGRLL